MQSRTRKLSKAQLRKITELSRLVRYHILVSTTRAGSGHPTTSLSATDLMTTLFFGGFYRFDPQKPDHPNNDRLVFSKGHASPLLYALYTAAGAVTERQLLQLRKFGSSLEGHPCMAFPYTESATGSLGQGLSIGVGMALNAKYLDDLPYLTWVLLGDSEMSEGSVWEAVQIAAHYKLNNLIGILDVNRLGQRGETMYGHNVGEYEKRLAAFGWKTIVVDGHSVRGVFGAYNRAVSSKVKPVMIIARTLKGKGVPQLEDKNGWHGKPLPSDMLEQVLFEFGKVNRKSRGRLAAPTNRRPKKARTARARTIAYELGEKVATRRAYGNALKRLYPALPKMVVLDAEVSNSTYSEIFAQAYPERYFEMYIAEQNMAGVAAGLARRGKLPFVSSFAAFLTRACDQIRMNQYSRVPIVFCGSHAGVSIGEDGPSQMALEDIAMFRSLLNSCVLYPSDAVSCEKLVEQAARRREGVTFIRTTRSATPVLYRSSESFPIGGSKVLCKSRRDAFTVVGAGITLHEALKAYDILKQKGILIRVLDLYSIKPIDSKTLQRCLAETGGIICVEDHFAEGGIAEAVKSAFHRLPKPVYRLAVKKIPGSGKPAQLLDDQGISANAIVKLVRKIYRRG